MTPQELRASLTQKLVRQRTDMDMSGRYYDGTQPMAFLDPELARAMQGRLRNLGINFGRLAIDALAERLQVAGFTASPGLQADASLWQMWQANAMDEQSQLAQLDCLVYGRAYFLAWANPDGFPIITAESPLQMTVTRDPVTRGITAAIKRWRDDDGYVRTLVLTPDWVREYASHTSTSLDAVLGTPMPTFTEDGVLTAEDPNPLGIVPVVALVNRPRLSDPDGISELCDLMGPIDAIAKLSTDMMTAAEYSASPRRWVTGMLGSTPMTEQAKALMNTITAAWEQARASKLWLAASPDTKFGQFDSASLSNFETAITLLTEQIAALAALPPYYVNGNTANPTSADAIRASESRLTDRARQRQRWWSGAYEDLMRLCVTIRDGIPNSQLDDLSTVWVDPPTPSIAQTADAQSKLYAAGIIDRRSALQALGFDVAEIDRMTNSIPAIA